jgi:hypothetical protein
MSLRHPRHPVDSRRPTLGEGFGPGTCSAPRRNRTSTSNTLYQRLESITELFGDLWRTPQHSLALRPALEITDLAARTSSGRQ